ncbi:MerR family transcriptional regulator [Bombilactobacillus bombi]|uniref:MerR family transcriptional regulator n=1 Tax=Bombilactobacillus bombi TaxID=1303590 RepID=UPI0015E60B36|nr:MerR family transcriptional regulator [Bombilactobacillus bombi]MBA1435084.1 MerR family transcriptional regulator [Bombilactobacillus bombi]
MNKYYTVAQLAELAGISPRALRYYDQINLLRPSKIDSNGYRLYNNDQVNQLQQILYFKNLGFKLAHIKAIMKAPDYNVISALKVQKKLVQEKLQYQIHILQSLDQALQFYQGEKVMTNTEKFAALKQAALIKNTQLYQDEAIKNYGKPVYNQVQKNLQKMSPAAYQQLQQVEQQLIKNLNIFHQQNLPVSSSLAATIFNDHKTWLKLLNPHYTNKYHYNLAQLYQADARFAEYYNTRTNFTAAPLLAQIIEYYTAYKK